MTFLIGFIAGIASTGAGIMALRWIVQIALNASLPQH